MRRLLGIAAISLAAFGCATMMTGDAESQIRAAGPRFMSAFNAGDVDTLTAFYADDAVVLAPNAEIAQGPSAIRQAWSFMVGMMPRPSLSFSADRIVVSGNLAYEYGRYQMQMGSMSDRGKYLTVWRRMANGEWKIVADAFNTSMPAPGM